jgi:hypothetical protein
MVLQSDTASHMHIRLADYAMHSTSSKPAIAWLELSQAHLVGIVDHGESRDKIEGFTASGVI